MPRDAMQFVDSVDGLVALGDFMVPHDVRVSYESKPCRLCVPAAEGDVWIEPGTWLGRDPEGELYVCGPDMAG